MSVTLLLADDHPVYRLGLRMLLQNDGFHVVGEAGDGNEAVALAGRLRPDIAVLDWVMPQLNGLDAAKQILRLTPRTKVMLVTGRHDERYVAEAFQAGVRGYVVKSETASALVKAIHEVNQGNAYISPSVAGIAVNLCVTRSRGVASEPLSPREQQVLKLIAERNTTREIAAALALSVKTAESYRMGVMNKLGIHETAGLVRYAVRQGMVKP